MSDRLRSTSQRLKEVSLFIGSGLGVSCIYKLFQEIETYHVSLAVKLTASGLRSPLCGNAPDTPITPAPLKTTQLKPSTKPLQSETVSGEAIVHDDLDEAFSNLTGLSVITLYNCIDLISSSEETREHFFKVGAMQILWCRLLTASSSTIQQIGLPTEMLLNTCCCMSMLEKYYSGMFALNFYEGEEGGGGARAGQ